MLEGPNYSESILVPFTSDGNYDTWEGPMGEFCKWSWLSKTSNGMWKPEHVQPEAIMHVMRLKGELGKLYMYQKFVTDRPFKIVFFVCDGSSSKGPISIEAVKDCYTEVASICDREGVKSVAIPLIGDVEPILPRNEVASIARLAFVKSNVTADIYLTPYLMSKVLSK